MRYSSARGLTLLCVLVLILGTSPQSSAQEGEEFPRSIQPGERFLNPATSGVTYWILRDEDLRSFVTAEQENRLLSDSVELLERKVEVQTTARETREDQLDILQEGYAHYRGRYQDALNELEQLELELARERGRRITITVIGVGAALFAGGVTAGMSLAD